MSEIIPIKEKIYSQPFVVVGVILEKDNRFLLVQEGKVDVGTWNIPAGWLDLNEDIISGAKREAKEETGLDIEITGFLGVYTSSKLKEKRLEHPVRLIFSAKPLSDKLNPPAEEILDAKWFTYDEVKKIKDEQILRSRIIIKEIDDFLAGHIYPLEVIKPFVDYTQK